MLCKNGLLLSGIILIQSFGCIAQLKHSKTSRFMSYKGLVMTGYQGWFNAKGDGGNRGWNHYVSRGTLEPGNIKIDMWPEIQEYKKTYATPFIMPNGDSARLFSSYDESTVQLHFKWMQDYAIDGAFVQRFVSNLKNKTSLVHNDKVLSVALDAAAKSKLAIAVMYDFSGMNEEDDELVIRDFKHLVDDLNLTTRGNKQSYLYHNSKPLVVLWGVGFNDHRKYTLKSVTRIMNFLQHDPIYGGCAIMLGVPSQWRELKNDTESDENLPVVYKKADIIHPWFVGRYDEGNLSEMMKRIAGDITWCKSNGIDYVPTVYPGFSWHNMYGRSPMNQIPRNRGSFFWKQLSGAIGAGAEMIYVAMFDEVDEGTAIFKISQNPPQGQNSFVTFEAGIPSDYYLRLTGHAAKMLKKIVPFQDKIPNP